ncbi:hypothetical protein [Alteraurantiacibacter aquimixticola]|uniref:hypothetical protein n=1 Tax=Alteraurantiacibacter aquimixticola TaxID=2489173 RepID=UPI001B7D790D|nr:hypothetical protein [Alteraurantiacibacter aquimixticola]
MTNQPGEDYLNFHYAIARSEVQERMAGLSLWIAWSDLAAHARSSEQLYLISFDEREHTVESRPFPRDVILQAETDIATLNRRLADTVRHFRERCSPSDDIDPPPPVII